MALPDAIVAVVRRGNEVLLIRRGAPTFAVEREFFANVFPTLTGHEDR